MLAKIANYVKTFIIRVKYIVYRIANIIKIKKVKTIIKLLFSKFYSVEVKKIKDIHFI